MLKEIILFCALTYAGCRVVSLFKRVGLALKVRRENRPKRMSLVERWRDEERRMREAEAARAAEAEPIEDDEEEPFCEDEPEILFCDDEEGPDDTEEAVCALCGVSADDGDDKDDAFCEKELRRLLKVRSGLELKAAKMKYVWQTEDESLSAEARSSRREKLEATKAWRGLQFDLGYVNNEIKGLEEWIKRG